MRQSGIVWDNHACLPFSDTARWLPELARYRRAGADAVTINIGDSHVPLEVLKRMADVIRGFVQANPDDYVLGLTTADIRAAKAAGRLAVCLDIEGVYSFDGDTSLVAHFYGLGVRWMLLVYNRRNLAGSGCHDDEDAGLTAHGRAILAEMDRVGMIKCCSHTGYRTARDILDATDRPVIFSHSNPRALHDHPRNIPDDLIRACAATGGVVGINGIGLFLGNRRPTAADVVRHADYVARLVGAAPRRDRARLHVPKRRAAGDRDARTPRCGRRHGVTGPARRTCRRRRCRRSRRGFRASVTPTPRCAASWATT